MNITRTDNGRFKNESYSEYCRRIVAIVTEYESLSEGHIRWFTHKNPYGCWICDLLQSFRTFVEESVNEDTIASSEFAEEPDKDSDVDDEDLNYQEE